jgi:hypothetical protein
VGLKITRLYNTFDENNKKIIDDINKVCKKKSKKTLRKKVVKEKIESGVTPTIEKFILTNCHAPENEIYFTQKGKESKIGDFREVSTAVNSQVEMFNDETPTEAIRPQKPKKIENTNISFKIESQEDEVIHNLEQKQLVPCDLQSLTKIYESIDHESVLLPSSKPIEKLLIYSIYVNYDCGFGNALYITGESEYLGSWQKAYKLSVASDCGKLWAFKSIQLKSGIEFKILIYKWVDEDNIVINNIDKNKIFWERPSGAKGNKLTIFTNSEMYHYPLFTFNK